MRTYVLGAFVIAAALPGCQSGSSNAAPDGAVPLPAPSGSAAVPGVSKPGPSWLGVPVPEDAVLRVINPKAEQPYAGPSGALRGTIRIKGDPAPASDFTFPPKCGEAVATYGKVFRTGQDGTAGDVLVAVTGYQGFVPAREPARKLTIHGCALSTRTMAVAFGQRIEVANLDKVETYMPYLEGARNRVSLVAVPMGDPVKLYPRIPGHYMIRDELSNPFLSADVFALAYTTHDVTGLDGQYEIRDIPVGKVKVSALLPAIDETVEELFEIKAGDNSLDLTLTFDAKKFEEKKKNDAAKAQAAAAASASASAHVEAPKPPPTEPKK